MNKKTFMAVFALILLASMLNEVLLFNVTNANPIPTGQIIPPPITIQSPINSTYYQNDILLSLTVDAPTLFPEAYHIDSVSYRIDEKLVLIYRDTNINNFSPEQFSANLTGLSKGEHTLTMYVNGTGHFYEPYSPQIQEYSVESNQTVTFTVTKDLEATPSSSPNLSISPSLSPSPTPNPTPSPSPTQTPTTEPNSEVTPNVAETPVFMNIAIGIAVAIIITAVGVGLFIYFRKHRGKPN